MAHVTSGEPAVPARPGPRVLGLHHLAPMPGTPFWSGTTLGEQIDRVRRAVDALVAGGADGILLQTSDRVYDTGDVADPATVATVTGSCLAARERAPDTFRVGVQIMRGAASASIAVAKVTGADFVRVSALVGATLSAHGWVEPDPLSIMRRRRALDAFDVELIADVDTVHFSWPGGQESVADIARRAIGVGADAVAVGHPDLNRSVRTLREIRGREPQVRLVLAGHSDFDTATRLLPLVDAAFVARCLSGGAWDGTPQPELVRRYVGLAAAAAVAP